MKLLTVVGARPQFVKLAPLSRAIREYNSHQSREHSKISNRVLHTGQHYDSKMSQVFFDELQLDPPQIQLQIHSTTHAQMTAEMLIGVEKALLEERPDYLLVFGDTNSTLAGALSAAKLGIPVVHVEAGERSYNRAMPEEINRVISDHLASLCFCSSESARKNLLAEGVQVPIEVVGDVMYDLFLSAQSHAAWPSTFQRPAGPFTLCTLHRPQNVDDPRRLKLILEQLEKLECNVVFPLHPRTAQAIKRGGCVISKNVLTPEPFSYHEMVAALGLCAFVITDSGGLQKEAYYAGKKSIVVRDETEWMDLIKIDAARLVTPVTMTDPQLMNWARTQLDSSATRLYGDGAAAVKIVEILIRDYETRLSRASVS